MKKRMFVGVTQLVVSSLINQDVNDTFVIIKLTQLFSLYDMATVYQTEPL